jgi:UDP-N-acetylglucosamine 2-epimerase (non-hydrolysing)
MHMQKKILIVVGTRPNFIKITQFKKNLPAFPSLEVKIVHTGQHYDSKMADVFFRQFDLVPDYFLNIPSASANTQMGEIMIRLEQLILSEYKPDLLVVVGDVNSTLAAALTANKLDIKLAHVESGLRSHDRSMPEEINRILTDEIADYFFVTEQSGYDNLIKEGKKAEQLFFVGNTMIDTLVTFEQEIERSSIASQLNLKGKKFILVTMHRPATVDHPQELIKLVELLERLTSTYSVVFPVHPRTLKKMESRNVLERVKKNASIIFTEPLDYFSFQHLVKHSCFIVTDSGGIQEESTFLGVPCLTLRSNTERPVTCTIGTNTLIPFDAPVIDAYIKQIEQETYKKGERPPYWDGQSTHRILNSIHSFLK